MADDFPEKRASPRFPARSLVEVKLPSWDALRGVYLTNISLGGVRLTLGARPPIGAAIDIILTLPNGNRLHLPGRIANLGPDGSGDVGVKFEGLLPGTHNEIQRYIDDLQSGRDPSGSGRSPMAIPTGTLIKKE